MAAPCEDAPCCGCCGRSLYGSEEASFEPLYDPDDDRGFFDWEVEA